MSSPTQVKDPNRRSWEQDLLGIVLSLNQAGDVVQVDEHTWFFNRADLAWHVLGDREDTYVNYPFPKEMLKPILTPWGLAAVQWGGTPISDDELRTIACANLDGLMPYRDQPFFFIKAWWLRMSASIIYGHQLEGPEAFELARAMDFHERLIPYPGFGIKPEPNEQEQELLEKGRGLLRRLTGRILVSRDPEFAESDPDEPMVERPQPGEPDERSAFDKKRSYVLQLLMNAFNGPTVTLAWTVHLLLRHPQETLNRRASLMEALRLFPLAWILSREVKKNDEVEGVAIPAKATVATSPYLLHRSERYWEHPDEFRPQRFAQGLPKDLARGAYLPFGLGARRCPGRSFALQALEITLEILEQRFTWESTGTEVRPWGLVSLRPIPDIDVKFTPR
jgi:cytochrome P450